MSFSGILTFIEKLALTQPTLAQPAVTIPAVTSSGISASFFAGESEPALKKLAVETHTSSTDAAVHSSSNSGSSSSSASGVLSAADAFKADLCYSLQETLFAMLVIRILLTLYIYTYTYSILDYILLTIHYIFALPSHTNIIYNMLHYILHYIYHYTPFV